MVTKERIENKPSFPQTFRKVTSLCDSGMYYMDPDPYSFISSQTSEPYLGKLSTKIIGGFLPPLALAFHLDNATYPNAKFFVRHTPLDGEESDIDVLQEVSDFKLETPHNLEGIVKRDGLLYGYRLICSNKNDHFMYRFELCDCTGFETTEKSIQFTHESESTGFLHVQVLGGSTPDLSGKTQRYWFGHVVHGGKYRGPMICENIDWLNALIIFNGNIPLWRMDSHQPKRTKIERVEDFLRLVQYRLPYLEDPFAVAKDEKLDF